MSSNSLPASLVNTMHSFPLLGKQIEEQLNDPSSPLYKDLYNARMNALADRLALEKEDCQFAMAKKLQHELDELDDELAQQRELSRIQNCHNLEQYYAHQHQLAAQENVLLSTFEKAAYHSLLTSLTAYTQESVITQNQLAELQNRRATLLQQYAENKQAYANAVLEKISSGAAYYMDGQAYSLDISALSEGKQQSITLHQQEAAGRLAQQKSTTEVMGTLPETHPARQQFNQAGMTDRAYFITSMNTEIILFDLVSPVVHETHSLDGKDLKKLTRLIINQWSRELSFYQVQALEGDKALDQTSRNTVILLAQALSAQENINRTLLDLSANPYVKSHKLREKAVNRMIEISNINVDLTPSGLQHGAAFRGQ